MDEIERKHDSGVDTPAKTKLRNYKNLKQAHKAAEKLIDPYNFHSVCGGDCAWAQDAVCDVYGEALRLGIIETGLLKEIGGLLKF